MIELFVSNKKELQIEDSPLFKSSKMLQISNGIPKNFDILTFKKYLTMIELEDLIEFSRLLKSI